MATRQGRGTIRESKSTIKPDEGTVRAGQDF